MFAQLYTESILSLSSSLDAAEEPCQTSPCSDICGVVNGTEQCFCPVGYELSTPGGIQCIGTALAAI